MSMFETLKNELLNLKYDKFVSATFDELNVGDIVMSETMTFSQKYIFKEGCEEYNMKKYGILTEKNLETPGLSTIIIYDEIKNKFTETNLFANPGTSGYFSFRKYIL
jgi:hypothetical protein